jgi:putative iron-dependent peroxidase
MPQPGIFALGTRSHHHLELQVFGDPREVAPAVHRIREAATTVVGVNVVVGFGHRTWAEIAPDHVPVDLAGFEPITGPDGFEMPATQHDVWLWIHGHGPDSCFDVARLAARELAGCAKVVAEQGAFAYGASQDLTGFEDGTQNPPVDEAPFVATIPEGQPCAGGSIVLVQRWVHDLDGIEALELADRELVIGRTLQGSVELDEEHQSPRAHISRVVIEDDEGEELEVFRRSVAYGGVQEHGLVFVAFSADRARVQTMLERMVGRGDGVRDRLTDFSTPVTGAWYVTPPLELLQTIGQG